MEYSISFLEKFLTQSLINPPQRGFLSNILLDQIAAMIGGPTVTVDPVVEPRETLANNSKAKNLLGWSPSVIIEEWVPKYKKDLGI